MPHRPTRRTACLFALAVLVVAFLPVVVAHPLQLPQQPTPAFRTHVTLVPIDVRVIDRNGKPVTDLNQDDFTVLEDGVPQAIRHFERQVLRPEQPGGSLTPRAIPTLDLAPQTRRVFLIVLGRLWLPTVHFRTTEALVRFVRERLLPQDYVSVYAWERATEFTTDHERVAQVIERLERYQNGIDRKRDVAKRMALNNYRFKPIPPAFEAELDEVFNGPAGDRGRAVPRAGQILSTEHLEHEIRDQMSVPGLPSPSHITVNSLARMAGGALQMLLAGIRYLRYVEGEKHLILLTNGLGFPSGEDDRSVAAVASDARVALDIIRVSAVVPAGLAAVAASTRNVAEMTGGLVSIADYADRVLTRIDQTTRVGYLLGYYPSNSKFDGRYRRLAVKVARPPGATVLYRHGYYAQDKPAPYDVRQLVVYDRITSAGEYDKDIQDIKVTLKASLIKQTVSAEALIDVSRVSFQEADGLRSGSLNIAFFCGDGKENLVGQAWKPMDLKLTDEAYRRALKEGVACAAQIPVKGAVKYVKAVVYDYGADLIGTAVTRVR